MVRYECVAKSVKHDKAEQRAQRHHKKQCRHFDAATEKAATVKDQHKSDGHSDRPRVSNRTRGINPPLRINKRKLCRPKYLAEVKPNSPTRNQQSLDRSEGDKHPCALMIFFPPNGHQTDTEREDNERNDFQERTAADRLLFQPENQEQRRRQCAGRGFSGESEQIKYERGKIQNPAMLMRSIDIFDPRQQSEQKEETHQNILQLRDPPDRLDLNRVQREYCRSQPCAGNFQARKDAPHEKRIAKVKQDIHPMIAHGI